VTLETKISKWMICLTKAVAEEAMPLKPRTQLIRAGSNGSVLWRDMTTWLSWMPSTSKIHSIFTVFKACNQTLQKTNSNSALR